MFELIRPWTLFLLVPTLLVLGWYFVRSLSDFPRPQRIVSLATRSLVVLLVLLALAGLTWLHETRQLYVVFLVDQSLSVGENGVEAMETFLDRALESRAAHEVAVAVGEGADTDLLESIARIGKGRYYFTDDPAQVPQIFARKTVTASKSAIDEQPFVPQVIRATHALADLEMDAAPFLLGYVITRPKPTSEVILATEKGDPLLAWWRYGLGMSAAFTSDAKSRWAAEWMTWPRFGKFWTQVVRQTMRKNEGRGIAVQTLRKGKQASLTVDAVNDLGQFLNNADVDLTIIGPQLRRETSFMRQAAPGRYAAAFETPMPGAPITSKSR